MRLQISQTKNAASYYVVKSVYENGKRTNKVYEKLGTYKELKAKLGDREPREWAEEYVAELNRLEKEGREPDVIARYSPYKRIEKDVRRSFNGGYLFLQQIYYELKLHKLCRDISQKYKFKFNLDSILSRLIYGRILFPLSKLATFEESKKFIEQPDFDLHQIYRALGYIAKETDFIQSSLYENSLKISKRNTGILYYDCTNFFFEIEEAEGNKQYGAGKDHKPNPIVQMGLFMDGDGIPLAFSINRGNMNEQLTLKPLEKKIISDFKSNRTVTWSFYPVASLLLLWILMAYPALMKRYSFIKVITIDIYSVVLFLISLDIYSGGNLYWSVFPVASLLLVWVWFLLVYLFGKKNKYFMFIIAYISTGLYLYLIEQATRSVWFFELALPILSLILVFTLIALFLSRFKPFKGIGFPGLIFFALSLFCIGTEFIINRFVFEQFKMIWSYIVAGVCIPVSIFLLFVQSNEEFRVYLQKKFHL
jgi:hypothetical protein